MLDKMQPDKKKIVMAQLGVRAVLKDTKIKDIMTPKVVSIQVDALFSEVPKKFNQFGIRHLPVVDQNQKLVGLMTQRDLYKIQSPRKLEDGGWYYDEDALNENILERVMLKDPLAMSPEDSVGDALLAMVRNKYGCIPIADKNKKLCGILTRVDILKMAARIYAPEKFV